MESNQLNSPKSLHKGQDKDRHFQADKVIPPDIWDDEDLGPNPLERPETFLNEIEELTGIKATPHAEILSRLLEQFEPLDFEALANPHNAENFKLTGKHYTVLSIENVLRT